MSASLARLAKNDSSTIDSFRLPLQTSINEWEFRYDFIPRVAEPKVPPITQEAVKQDIAHEKKALVEKELFNRENASSVKVEANSATVVHGGEAVGSEPEYLHDRGSKPVDSTGGAAAPAKKPVNRDKYVQSSLNPNINNSEVVNLGQGEVDHKASHVDKQTPVVDDIEHDNVEGATKPAPSGSNPAILALLGLGGAGGAYYYFKQEKK